MTKTIPLDERISLALGGSPSSSELAGLLSEAVEADRQAQETAAAARARALDPATPPKAVAEARKEMEDAQFLRDRLAVATGRLDILHKDAVRAELEAERQKQVAALTVERDAMVAELTAEYPAMVSKLVDLLKRMILLDAQCVQFGVQTSEMVARPGRQMVGSPLTSLAHGRLVAFEIKPDPWDWAEGRLTEIALSMPRQRITVATKRVRLTNTQRGPRGYHTADGKTHVLEPGDTSPEVLMTEGELSGPMELEVKIIGPGAPVTR